VSLIHEKALNLPAVPGVYLWKDARGAVLYVGKAKSLAHRVRSYLAPDLADPKTRELMSHAADLDVVLTDSEVEALLLESSLVRQHRPRYNITLQDDKSYPYVKVTVQEEFPRVSVTRQVRSDGARYLGPYTDVKHLRRTLREIRRVFPVRTCWNFEDYRRRDRPCLYYHIRRCTGPCYSKSAVSPAEYRGIVDQMLLFLTGRDEDLLQRLKAEMHAASEAREFEVAARRRDQIHLLESARRPQKMVMRTGGDVDVVGITRHSGRAAVAVLMMRGGRVIGKESHFLVAHGEPDEATLLEAYLSQRYLPDPAVPRAIALSTEPASREVTAAALSQRAGRRVDLLVPQRGRLLRLVRAAVRNAAHALEDAEARRAGRRARFSEDVLELQRVLGLAVPPFRMVCFDISNLGSEGAVAAIVASENGVARKGLYRKMRIRRPGPDDFAMIAEAVERYWTHVESGEMPRPDLVLVDGGPGQLSAARAALERSATTPVALFGLAKREEEIVLENGPPLRLPRRSPALRALQRLRDEAHRFGLTYHRVLRRRARIASEIDRVPGVGPARRAALLKEFGSVAALKAATAGEIADRARVPLALAQRVVDRLAATGHGFGGGSGGGTS